LTGRWLVSLGEAQAAAFNLVCLPWGGGGAVGYRDWQAHQPANVSLWAVEPPGRGPRLLDEPERHFDRWIDAIGREVQQFSSPVVLFGHSFGSILAFELASWLRRHACSTVELVCVSSRRCPGRPSKAAPLATAADAELIAWIRRLGGVHADILASTEMLELILPPLRDDIRLDADYVARGGPLEESLLAFAGRDDPLVSPADVGEWQAWTTAGYDFHLLPGGHFHLLENANLIFKEIDRALGGRTQRHSEVGCTEGGPAG
jgi:surfactin synthase thioesterase subunit